MTRLPKREEKEEGSGAEEEAKEAKGEEEEKEEGDARPDPGHLGLQGYSIYITNLAIFSLQGPTGKRATKKKV